MRNEGGGYAYYTHLKCGNRHSNVDYTGPIINLKGTKKMTINKGDTYKEPGVLTVKDNKDGELKVSDVTISGKVDTNKIGKYQIKYTASDSLDNETVVTREVEVIEKSRTIESNSEVNSNPD